LKIDKDIFIEKASVARVLVLGDIMLDRYLYGDVKRISPEAPIPVVKITRKNDMPGGAANVACNIKELNVSVILAGIIGDDESGRSLLDLFKEKQIEFYGITSRPTTTKTRIIGVSQQMLRIDEEQDFEISEDEHKSLLDGINSVLNNVQVLIISDYNKGVCVPGLCADVIKAAKAAGIMVIIDPKSANWEKYKGADIITPNFQEFCEALTANIKNTSEDIAYHAKDLISKYDLGAVLVTRSEQGMVYVSKADGTLSFSATAREVYDVSGAGDTVVAVLSAFLVSGFSINTSVEYANIAAGISVGKLGTYTVTTDEIFDSLNGVPDIKDKICSFEKMKLTFKTWRGNKEKIVFTNGCFDILHSGHIHYLKKASEQGDRLIIGLNTDGSVKRLKGETRPINSESDRAFLLSALAFVDMVVLFDEDTPADLIKVIQPDVMVKGGDYKPEEVIGREYAGELVIVPFLEGFSSTEIIEKINTCTVSEAMGNEMQMLIKCEE